MNDNKTFFDGGNSSVKAGYFKFLEIPIYAPNEPGNFTYDFCYGTDEDHLFGQRVQITLNVEGEKFEEPESRIEVPDDLEFSM